MMVASAAGGRTNLIVGAVLSIWKCSWEASRQTIASRAGTDQNGSQSPRSPEDWDRAGEAPLRRTRKTDKRTFWFGTRRLARRLGFGG